MEDWGLECVCRIEDEAAGQIPVACVVKAPSCELSEQQVIQFVASQVLFSFPPIYSFFLGPTSIYMGLPQAQETVQLILDRTGNIA